MKKKILAGLLAAVMMVGALSGCSGGDGGTTQPSGDGTASVGNTGETYKLVVSLTKGENNTQPFQNYLHSIEEASGGRIEFEIYYNNQLMQVSEIPQSLESGVADISEFILSEFPTLFPLSSTIVGLPFMGMSNDTIETFGMLYDEFPEIQQEFSNAKMVMLSYLCTQPYNIHLTTSKEVRVPGDLNGLKLITSRTDITNFLSSVGASGVSSAPPDYYSNLSNGVVEGTILHWPMMLNNGLTPTCKQHLLVEEGGGIYMDTSVYVISTGAWEKLPEDLQALFTDEERLNTFFYENQEDLEKDGDAGLQEAIDSGHTVNYMTEDEVAQWREAFEPLNSETVAGLDGQGLPATQIYERALEIIESLKG